MLSVNEEIGDYVRDYIMIHVISNVMSWACYWKGMQTTFFKKLITILNRGQLRPKIIDIKLQKVNDFSLSQNIGLVCK